MSLTGKKMAQPASADRPPLSFSAPREGEVALAENPAGMAADAQVVFIGRVRSPWSGREDCPKNMAEARLRGLPASVEVGPAFRRGLEGLERFSHVVLLTWLDRAPRDLIIQKPRHAAAARGVFALRSPARPNPVGLHVVRLTGIDAAAGILSLEAIDVVDGTPVVDIKPYFASTDAFPDAEGGSGGGGPGCGGPGDGQTGSGGA